MATITENPFAEFDRVIAEFARTGIAPTEIEGMPVTTASRQGTRVFLTACGDNGDFIAGSRCDLHPDAIMGCMCD